MEVDNFWSQILPNTIHSFAWGESVAAEETEAAWMKNLVKVLPGLDDEEFNVFLAKLVISASGAGVVGKTLTDIVQGFKAMRVAK